MQCINQTDIPERNRQLGLMAQIYDQAQRVAIYIGESRDNSDLAMDCISEIHAPSYDSREDRILRPETDMLQSLLNRPWFNRIWVLQEVIMSQLAVAFCGSKSVP